MIAMFLPTTNLMMKYFWYVAPGPFCTIVWIRFGTVTTYNQFGFTIGFRSEYSPSVIFKILANLNGQNCIFDKSRNPITIFFLFQTKVPSYMYFVVSLDGSYHHSLVEVRESICLFACCITLPWGRPYIRQWFSLFHCNKWPTKNDEYCMRLLWSEVHSVEIREFSYYVHFTRNQFWWNDQYCKNRQALFRVFGYQKLISRKIWM